MTWLLALAAAAVLLAPASSYASHLAEAPEGCSNCHTLSTNEGDVNTSGISYASRTLTTMRILNGSTPATFGCTFCHNNDSNTTKMKGALSHFQGKASMHPVGKKLSIFSGGADTFNEFLSSANVQYVEELDCVDCHDPLLVIDQSAGNLALDAPYANHVAPTHASRTNNPYMLRDFADANPSTYPNYSASTVNFCRICHGTVAVHVNPEGQDVTLTSHAETAIAESDGTPLRTSACSGCHRPHSAVTNQKLFTSTIDMGNVANCTNAVCHENGDANNNFTQHGHGMPTSTAGNPLGFKCGACHSVNSLHDGSDDVTNPKMFNYTEDSAVSPFGKSVESVCYICHGGYVAHTGGGGSVSCVDCHDEHAEGSGVGSNSYMIPLQLPNNNGTTELVTYDRTDGVPYDYYRSDGAGLCDNGVCHAGITVPDPLGGPAINIAPLSNIMSNAAHTGDNQGSNTVDCGGCHTHGDVVGSWSAASVCDDCHGLPPTNSANTEPGYTDHTEANTPHSLHAKARGNGGYGIACQECHGGWTNSASHRQGTYDSIWFKQTTNPLTTAYNPSTPTVTPDYNKSTETCSNLYCHSSGATGNSVGSQQWMSGTSTPDYVTVDLGCDACHAAPPPNGNHTAHVTAGVGCQNCHFGTTADGTTIDRVGGLHVNRVKDVGAGGTFASVAVTFGWSAPNCTAISCHGGSGATWGGTLSCYSCHTGAEVAATKPLVDTIANPVSQAEYELRGHGVATGSTFPGSLVNGPGYTHTSSPGCYNCHETTAQHFPAASVADPFRLGAYATNTDGLCSKAAGCHTLAENHTHKQSEILLNGNWMGYDFKCVDCHDPHGDTNYYMIRRSINAPTATSEVGGTDFGSNSYGTPQGTANASTVTFTSLAGGATANSYGVNTATNGLCEVCHVDTANVTYYRRDVNETNTHNTSGKCTTCHTHATGFKPSGCSGCHGGGTTGTVSKNYWPDTAVVAGENTAGAHPGHMEALSQKVYNKSAIALLDDPLSGSRQQHLCSYCHANPGGSGHDAAPLPADVRSGFGRMWNSADPVVAFDTGAFAQGAAETCATVDCHYRKVTPAWYSGATATCSTCHAASGYTTAASLPAAHDKHAGAASLTGYSYACTQCHPTNATNYHADNVVQLAPTTMTHNEDADATFLPSTTPTVKYNNTGSTTCGNVYCHGDFTTTTNLTGGGNANSPAWNGGAAAAACGSCHGLTTATVQKWELLNAAKAWPRTGSYTESHGEHIKSNANPNCSACHDSATGTAGLGTYGDFTQHANGTISDGGIGGLTFGNATGEPTTVEDETTAFQLVNGIYNDTVGNGAATGSETCSNIRCHNGVDTPAYDLTGGPNISCGKCHNDTWTPAGTSAVPSGLASVAGSHVKHATVVPDDCANCHVSANAYSAVGGNDAHQNLAVNVNPAHGYSDPDGSGGVNYAVTDFNDSGTCSSASCHGAGTPVWGDPTSVVCGSCHGDETRIAGVDPRDGAPPLDLAGTSTGTKVGKHVQHLSISNTLTGNYCNLCHNGFGSGGAGHADGTPSGGAANADLAFHSSAGTGLAYNTGTATCSATSWGASCHGNPGAGAWNSSFTLACTACHATGLVGSFVTASSPHTNSGACADCHAGHADGTTGANDVEIPTTYGAGVPVPTMNRQYAGHGNKIQLGGTATGSYSSEAQICWGCHYTATATDNAEFGVNSNPNTGPFSYNYGTLSTWDATDKGGWYRSDGLTPATWMTAQRTAPANFSYKDGPLQSMHGANFNASGPGNDTVGEIHCSYCHDVHDTGAAPNGVPYIRGSWRGNPFPEDGAPQSGQSYPTRNVNTQSAIGPFPRESSNKNILGGFQIEQNNTAATTGFTTTNMAGLCETCHSATPNGTWDAAEIDNLDWNYTTKAPGAGDAADIWVGKTLPASIQNNAGNGHANSVLGGTGPGSAKASDILSEIIRNPLFTSLSTADGANSGSPAMHFLSARSGTRWQGGIYGFRSHTGIGSTRSNYGWFTNPTINSAGIGNTNSRGPALELSEGSGFQWDNQAWDALTVTFTANTKNAYHRFPCSKCHTPHASRLPRLLVTNCLDIRHQTWDPNGAAGAYANVTAAGKVSPSTPNNTMSAYNDGKAYPQTTAANNCHRKADSTAPGYVAPGVTTGTHRGAGWNTVSPW